MTILGKKKRMNISLVDEDIRIDVASPNMVHIGQLRPVNQKGKSPKKFRAPDIDPSLTCKISNLLDSKINGDKLLGEKLKSIE